MIWHWLGNHGSRIHISQLLSFRALNSHIFWNVLNQSPIKWNQNQLLKIRLWWCLILKLILIVIKVYLMCSMRKVHSSNCHSCINELFKLLLLLWSWTWNDKKTCKLHTWNLKYFPNNVPIHINCLSSLQFLNTY